MNGFAQQARAYLEDGKMDAARRVIIQALEKSPNDPYCWLVMGQIQAESLDYDWAAQSLEKYLHLLKAKHDAI